MIAISIALLVLTGAISTVRLFRGPSIADRVISLDVMLLTLMGGIAILAADRNSTLTLVAIVTIAVVTFTATVALTRYIERSEAT